MSGSRKSKRRLEMGEEAWAEHKRQRRNRNCLRRTKTNATYVILCRRNNKKRLIAALGGKCVKCGYDKPYLTTYHFHHRDKETKEFQISKHMSRSYETLLAEAMKCDLLCANCHSELHDDEYTETLSKTIERNQNYSEDDIEYLATKKAKIRQQKTCLKCECFFDPTYKTRQFCSRDCRIAYFAIDNEIGRVEQADKPLRKPRVRKTFKKICLVCNDEFETRKIGQQYCSLSCVGTRVEARKVTNRPSKEELEQLIATTPWTTIAATYGVSDNAVKKWARRYGIECPKRLGYWGHNGQNTKSHDGINSHS